MNSCFPTFSTGFALSPKEAKYSYLWNGLVGMWCPSLGKQGEILQDLSLYNHRATLIGMDASTDYIADIKGYALNYDGINDHLDIGHIEEIDNASQDLTFVFRTRTTANSNNAIFTYDTNDSLSPSSDIYIYNNPGGLNIGGIGDAGEHATGVSINDGQWHWIAVRLKGTELSLFKDGVKVYSLVVGHNHGNYGVTHNFRIADNSNINHYLGDIGDFFVYNRGLEDSEIIDLQVGRTPLVPISTYIVGKYMIPSVDDTTDFSLDDEVDFKVDTRLEEDFTLNDSVIIKLAKSAVISDNFTLDDEIDLETSVNHEASFGLSDEIVVNIPVEHLNLEETFTFGDSAIVTKDQTAKYATRIISFNPLIIITDTDPVEIVKVDITDPSNPSHTTYTVSQLGETVKNAKDIVYNSSVDVFYIACADGQILEVKGTDFEVRTQHDTGDTDNLLQIASLEGFNKTYVGTEDLLGEVIMMDQSEITSLGLDIRFLAEVKKSVGLVIDTVDAISLGMDIRFLAETKTRLGLDIRFHSETNNPFPTVIPPANPDPNSPVPTTGAPLNPISREDFHVYIDSVEATDVKLETILIYHTIDNKTTASFTLNRKHDQLNNRLDGTSSQITNQNNIEIKIQGRTEFTGKIQTIDCQSETETVKIEALGDFKTDDRKTVTLSLPTLDETLHIYHALIHNPIIYNPVINDDDENPEFYKGVKVDLGRHTIQTAISMSAEDPEINIANDKTLAEQIMDGDFQSDQPWTYFWTISSAENFLTGKEISDKYIGTSMSGMTTDLWYLNRLSYTRQREYSDISTGKIEDLWVSPGHLEVEEIFSPIIPTDGWGKSAGGWGETSTAWAEPNDYKTYYVIGEAPYNEISARNGKCVSIFKYVDKPNGWYQERDAGHNFLNYAKEVADINYEMLKNINGNILPKTSASIELFIDGYYYYGLSLLTRLNFDNTTVSSIYNSNNGFPVSIKGIEINSSTMKVTLKTDNSFSTTELEEIEENLPDENSDEYNFPPVSMQIAPKYDPAQDSFPE